MFNAQPASLQRSSAGSPEPTGAFFYMDAMRTVFALIVAFGHAWALIIRDYRPPAGLAVQACYYAAGFGHQAVILFFVLSGFWISRTVVRGAARGWSWANYLIDRLTRLLPVLFGALAIGGLLDLVSVYILHSPTHLGLTDTYVLRIDIARHLTWEVLLANAAFLQLLVGALGSNGPLWSLSYEFWFYIWFPALWLALRHRRPSIALVLLALGWFVPTLALAFLSWLCGAAVFAVAQWLGARPPWSGNRKGAMLLVTMVVLVGALAAARFGANGWKDLALAVIFAAFLLSLIQLNPPILALFRPLATFGARASFSFYATHFPVMAFAAGLMLGRQRLAPDLHGIGLVFAVLAAALCFAWVFARQTEGRTSALRYWIAGLRPAPLVGRAAEKAG